MRAWNGFCVVLACICLLFITSISNESQAACLPPAKIVGQTYSYIPNSIQEAYDFASGTLGLTEFILQLSGEIITEDLFLDGGAVLFDGGYDCSFTTKISTTGILGTITILTGAANFAGDVGILSTDRCDFDSDLDGFTRLGSCAGSADDCNDHNVNVYPGAAEICDGLDNDCNGQVDDGFTPTDADGDGYYGPGTCGAIVEDCNDNDAVIHPDALDIPYDGIDQDCSGADLTFENVKGNCVWCHLNPPGWSGLHSQVTAPNVSCAGCHLPLVSNILPGHYGRKVVTAGNGMTAGATIVCISCHDASTLNHLTLLGSGLDLVWGKALNDRPNITCDSCHENRAAGHQTAAAHDNRIIEAGCSGCHTSDTSSLGNAGSGTLASSADVDALHRSDCTLCHNYTSSSLNTATVRQVIKQGLNGSQVTCNDCHNKGVNHHASGSGSGSGCVACHGHDAGTLYDSDSSTPYSAGSAASQGRGTAKSHSTHSELDVDDQRGPGIYCDACHAINNFPFFQSGSDVNGDGRIDLTETDVCNRCHSAGGTFDGVNSPLYGAKANWQAGIYHADGSLQTGKGRWCVSCHDSVPANSKADGSGVAAPDKVGDNSSYGYYVTGHGSSSAYNATLHGQNGPDYLCTVCHDSRLPHISHSLGDATRLASIPDDGRDYTTKISEVCLDCHAVGQTDSGALGYDALAEATIHSGAVSGNFNSPATTAFPAYGDSADYAANPGYQCEACHEVHGTSKLAMILETIDGQVGGVSNPVIISGFEASDFDLSDLDPSSAENDGVCDACHMIGSDAHPDSNYPGNHNQGNNCAGCHAHNNNFQASCTGCHDSPPQSNAHLVHATTLGYDCAECHYNHDHNPGDIITSPAEFYNDYDRSRVDVAFDPAGFNADSNNGSVLGAALFTANTAADLASCANLTCHNPDNAVTGKGTDGSTSNIPVWGSTISTCEDCHFTAANSWTAHDFDGGAHYAHNHPFGAYGSHVDCIECHSEVNVVDPEVSGTDGRHADKILNIDQLDNYPIHVNADLAAKAGITATYVDGAPGTMTGGVCLSVYCHGNGLSSDAGRNLHPGWGVSGIGSCWDCHYFDTTFIAADVQSHAVHMGGPGDFYLKYGPDFSCGCHDINQNGNHANGRPNFLESADGTLASTTYCDNCHGTAAGIAEAKANWEINTKSDRHRITDCTYCHNAIAPANSEQNGTGNSASSKDNFILTGHGSNGAYSVTGNNGPGLNCSTCHDPDSPHIDPYGVSGTYTRLRPAPDGRDYTSATSELCLDCHQVGQNTTGILGYDASAEVSVHSGAVTDNYNTANAAAYPAYGNKADYAAAGGYQCEDCHDSHGTSKLTMLKESLNGKIGNVGNPVAVSGLETSDPDFTDLDPSAAPADGVCDACHALTQTSHRDTLHAGNHNQDSGGASCKACHDHRYSFAAAGAHAKITDQTGQTTDRAIDFGAVVATGSAEQSITVRNIGTADLVLGSIPVAGFTEGAFSIPAAADNCSTQLLAPATTCSFVVRFAPVGSGTFSDSFAIPSNDSASPAVITLTGTGTVAGPDISLSADSVTFAELPTAATAVQSIAISNYGTSPLTLGAIAAVDPLAEPFSIVNDACSNQTIAVGASCILELQFAPHGVGEFTDSFDIASDDPEESLLFVAVSGTGMTPVYAYIINYATPGMVYKINTADNTVAASYPVSSGKPQHIAVTPDGSRIYTSVIPGIQSNAGALDIFDPDGYLSTLSLIKNPIGLAPSPNGKYLYITAFDYPEAVVYDHFLLVMRTADNSIVASKPLPENSNTAVAKTVVSPDSSMLYIVGSAGTTTGQDTIHVIRTLDLSTAASISLKNPNDVDFSPDSSYAYIAAEDGVAVYQTVDHSMVDFIPISGESRAIGIHPEGSYAYVANYFLGFPATLSIIRTADNTLIDTIENLMSSSQKPESMSFTPDGRLLYITNLYSPEVVVFDTLTNRVVDTVTTGANPYSYGDFIQQRDPNRATPDITITDSIGTADDQGGDFGSLTIQRITQAQTITIANEGSADLLLGTIPPTAPTDAQFQIVAGSDNCSGQTLPPAASCTLQVVFAPTRSGSFYEIISIPSNDPFENPTAVTLHGVGLAPDIRITDDIVPNDDLFIPFGDRIITTSGYRMIIVSNDGAGDLVFSNLATAEPFSINLAASSCDSYMSEPGLPANGSCTLRIDFAPTSIDSFSEVVSIDSNDPDEGVVTVTLAGGGAPPGPDITPLISYSNSDPAITEIDFGYYPVTSSAAVKYVYARNDGTVDLTTGSISLVAAPGPFAISTDNLSGATITPGGISTSAQLRFDPATTGVFSTTLTIPNNDPDENPTDLPISGIGYELNYAFITNNYKRCTDCVNRPGLIRPATTNNISRLLVSYSAGGTVNTTSSGTISPGEFSYPFGVAATPSVTYVTLTGPSQVKIYQTANQAELASIDIGIYPSGIAATSDGRFAYVTNPADDLVTVINRATQAVETGIAVGDYPQGLAVTPDDAFVYVANYFADSVSVIRTADHSLIATIPVGSRPRGVAASPDSQQVFVSNSSGNSVSVLQTSDHTQIATIAVGQSPYGLVVTPDGSKVYVGNSTDRSVSVIHTFDQSVATIPLTAAGSIRGVDCTSDGRFVYVVSNQTTIEGSWLTIISTADDSIVRTSSLPVGATAFGRFLTPLVVDNDMDGVPVEADNCPDVSNALQTDSDTDGAGDSCDSCPYDAANDADGDGICGDLDNCSLTVNPDQADSDSDGFGDLCDACPADAANDIDGDGVCGEVDNCPLTANPEQVDSDSDGLGDLCDSCPDSAENDADGDGVCSYVDNCPAVANTNQADADGDGLGDLCDSCPLDANNDSDGDGICGEADNCPVLANTNQADSDSDGSGDLCDSCPNDADNDIDGDGVCGDSDNCPLTANGSQADMDNDGIGDGCDNCPDVANSNQADSDNDGIGDSCDIIYPATVDTSIFEESFSLALKADGSVWAWGDNAACELGDTTTTRRTSPVRVITWQDPDTAQPIYLQSTMTIAAGRRFAVASKLNGTVWGWGFNGYGQLGLGSTSSRECSARQVTDPSDPSGYLSDVKTVSAGDSHVLALKNNGTVWAWGINWYGQIGDNSTAMERSLPLQVIEDPTTVPATYLTNVVAVSAGADHSLALKADGTVWGWGHNHAGQLGLGADTTDKLTAVQITDPATASGYLTDVSAIAAGAGFNLALKNDKTVRAWGGNSYGNLGDNTTTKRTLPVTVIGPRAVGPLIGIIAISAGELNSIALKEDGTVWTWGSNSYGALGNNTDHLVIGYSPIPVQVIEDPSTVPTTYLTEVSHIATSFHGMAVKNDGSYWSWGQNIEGQLGNGSADFNNNNTAKQVPGL